MIRPAMRLQIGSAFLVLVGMSAMAGGHGAAPISTKSAATFKECLRECPLMVIVPAGEFSMGTDRLNIEGDGRDSPVHAVTFAKPFAIGVYDVTRGEFARFVGATGYETRRGCEVVDPESRWVTDASKDWRNPGFPQSDRDPVVCVSWNDAQAYISWLNKLVWPVGVGDGPYRLPSEAEWEYAARAGSTTSYYWGDEASHELANYGIEHCTPCGASKGLRDRWYFTSPVGSFPPNAFGLYDALGNVWQWTQDCTHYSYAGAPNDGSAWTADTNNACYNRVLRGGSWLDPGVLLISFLRNPWGPDDHNNANGFRVARTLDLRLLPSERGLSPITSSRVQDTQ